jgi:hypothetical protein
MRHPPLALYYAEEIPAGAQSFKPLQPGQGGGGGWGCAMFLLARAAKGGLVAFSRETCHCPGAAGGMGLGEDPEKQFPGGPEAFLRFLSSGNKHWETGRACGQKMLAEGADREMVEEYLEGEGFKKTPELVLDYLKNLPRIEQEGPVVVVRPLAGLEAGLTPRVVILLADAEQLSALVVLANFARPGLDNVRIPFGAGCQSIGLFPLFEAAQAQPKAVVGLTDISARLYFKKLLGRDLISFALPWSFYQEMEAGPGKRS